MSRPPSTPDSPTASTPRSRNPATSSLLTTPRSTAAATSSDWGSVTRRPPSNRDGTPSRSSHSVMRLPPPWTSTTGRRRGPRPRRPARTTARHRAAAELTTTISTSGRVLRVRSRIPAWSQPKARPCRRRVRDPNRSSSSASIAARAAARSKADRAALRAVEHRVTGDGDTKPHQVERGGLAGTGCSGTDDSPAAEDGAGRSQRPGRSMIRPQLGSLPWAAPDGLLLTTGRRQRGRRRRRSQHERRS